MAANAVMSGVPAEFMPICVAFAQEMNNGEWRKPLSSTHGWTPFAWLNGPLARQLGIDNQQGMISEANNKACVEMGWKPYHVQKGYDLNANTIIAGSALSWGNNVTPAIDDAEKIMYWANTGSQQFNRRRN
ncbi:MAG: hypothetical protein MJ182_00015 [Treponema sp.]|nr:hypothetical protein [Treponema sp.]